MFKESMMKKMLLVTAIAAMAGLLAWAANGCGSEGSHPQPGDGGGADSGPTDGGSGVTCGAATCNEKQLCNDTLVCVNKPTEDAKAYIPKQVTAPIGDPNMACYSGLVPPTDFPKAKVTGCVDVFGINDYTVDLEVSYYVDGDLSKAIAGPVVATADTTKKCNNTGYYEIDNIPTNTLLVRKVGCPSSNPKCGFHDTYQFNVYLNSAHIVGGVITQDSDDDTIANVVSDTTWNIFPLTAGIVGGIKKGHGAVAGRIRDCDHNHVFASMVGTTVPPAKLVYFNGLEGTKTADGKDKSSDPDPNRKSTNTDGLYGMLDVVPGQATISAAAQIGGVVKSMGTYKVQIVADSVTVMSFKGARPVSQK
jgi:hypothetical protein